MGVSKFIYLFFIFSLLSLVSAVNLDYGVVLNTSVSNSSMTFSVPITVDNFNITAFNITLNTIICSNGADPISQIVWDTPNANNDSAGYCIVAPPTPADDNSCTTFTQIFLQYPVLVGVIGALFLVGIIILFIIGMAIFRPGEEVTNEQIAIFFLTLMGIGLLIVIGIVSIGSICSTGVI